MKDLIFRYKNPIIFLLIVGVLVIVNYKIFNKYTLRKENLKKEFKKLDEGEVLIEKWGVLGGGFSKLKGSFLEKDTLSFKKFVERKAQDTRIKIASLNTSQKDRGVYKEVGMNIRASGDYSDLTSFLRSLEEKKIRLSKGKIKRTAKKSLFLGVAIEISLIGVIVE